MPAPDKKDINRIDHSGNHLKDAGRRRLAAAVRPADRLIRHASLVSVLAALCWVPMAGAVGVTFGALADGTATLSLLILTTGIFLAAGFIRTMLTWQASQLLDKACDRVLAAQRAAFMRNQDRLSNRSDRLESASAAALMADKIALFAPYIRRYRPAALRVAVIPVMLLFLSLPVSWAVTIILLISGPLIPVFMALVGLAAREASERQMAEIGSLSALLGERLSALTDIRLLAARGRMLSDFSARSEKLRERTMAVLRIAFLSSTVLELFAAIGVAMVAVYVGFVLIGELRFGSWETPLSLAEGVFLLMIAPEFFQPLRDLASAWHDKAAALAVAGELAEIEAENSSTILGEGDAVAACATTPVIRLSGLARGAVRFPDTEIKPGEALAITGRSGSGKSTLIALIGGLESADTGSILFGEEPLSPDNADRLRGHFAWVPQGTHFGAGTLRDELLIGAPEGTGDAAIVAALKLASADGIVTRLPDGLDTHLGETGAGVSGGEARRLMIARAALSRRPVILADEPTADLDRETADDIITALRALNARGVSVIAATHDERLVSALGKEFRLETPSMVRE